MPLLRILVLIGLLTRAAYSQSSSMFTGMGAKAAGMGYASSCLQDEWSLFNNTAGLSFVKKSVVATSYDARPQVEGTDRMAFLVTLPTTLGTGALGAFRFGDDVYNEQKISLGFSNKLGLASLGASINYLQYQALGFGTKSLFTFNVGGIATLTPAFFIGAHIQNVNQPVLSESSEERLSTSLTLGAGYSPTEKVWLTGEIQKQLEVTPTYKIGMEYKPEKKFAARSGINLYPNKLFLGIGFISTRLNIDYAYEYSLTGIGSSHQASLTYCLKKK